MRCGAYGGKGWALIEYLLMAGAVILALAALSSTIENATKVEVAEKMREQMTNPVDKAEDLGFLN